MLASSHLTLTALIDAIVADNENQSGNDASTDEKFAAMAYRRLATEILLFTCKLTPPRLPTPI